MATTGRRIVGVHNSHGSIADYAIRLVHMRGRVGSRGVHDTERRHGVNWRRANLRYEGVEAGDEKGDSGQ